MTSEEQIFAFKIKVLEIRFVPHDMRSCEQKGIFLRAEMPRANGENSPKIRKVGLFVATFLEDNSNLLASKGVFLQ